MYNGCYLHEWLGATDPVVHISPGKAILGPDLRHAPVKVLSPHMGAHSSQAVFCRKCTNVKVGFFGAGRDLALLAENPQASSLDWCVLLRNKWFVLLEHTAWVGQELGSTNGVVGVVQWNIA